VTAAAPNRTYRGPRSWQQEFDPLGPAVRQTTLGSGRTVNFIDEGAPSWPTALFFGGAGTTVRAFRLLEFARTFREQLGIRIVSLERNGLGQTPYDPGMGFAEYADSVWELADQLDIDQASLVAISGGGPYAAHVARAQPERVRSLHLACAFSERLDTDSPFDAVAVAADPVAWWRFPADSAVHRIPGFVDATIEEATRAAFARGRDQAPDGLAQAFAFYRDSPLPGLDAVRAPAFLYWGTADRLVPTAHLERWRAALPDVREVRVYPGEGHDVQYRHWDQILADLAHLGDRIVMTADGQTQLLPSHQAAEALADGAVLGLCAWS
jgi:non-heme chloroperoxidase